MKVVTNGYAYVDIDAYAGCIAYAELLQKQGFEAAAVSVAPLNESISRTVRSWGAPLQTQYEPSEDDTYILVDVSDPKFFEKFVAEDRVEEVIDHHPGFERYWQERLGKKATIEFIGAACTLVYERWRAAGLLNEMSRDSARLLVCGILDNTLNFGAKVTTQRDIDAYKALMKLSDLPDNWTAQYFSECQEAIFSEIVSAVRNDMKILEFRSYEKPMCVGQLVVWSGEEALADYQKVVSETLIAIKPDWMMNLVSVSEGKSYFVTDNKAVQNWLTELLEVTFEGSVAVADRLWLRKEIIKADIENKA